MKRDIRNACRGKVRHANAGAAAVALKKIKNGGLSSYPCPHWKGWRLGNSRNPLKIQNRMDQLLGKP